MFWRFVKFTRIIFRFRAGKNVLFRFLVLQGKNTLEEGIEEERRRRKMLMQRLLNYHFYHLALLKASTNMMYRSFYSNSHESEYNSEDSIHAIHLEKDNYVDDLETVSSEFEDMDNEPSQFHFLDASFVEDV